MDADSIFFCWFLPLYKVDRKDGLTSAWLTDSKYWRWRFDKMKDIRVHGGASSELPVNSAWFKHWLFLRTVLVGLMYWNCSQNWSVTYDGLCYWFMKIFLSSMERHTGCSIECWYREDQRSSVAWKFLVIQQWLFWKDLGRFNERQSVLPKLCWTPLHSIREISELGRFYQFQEWNVRKIQQSVSCLWGWKWKTKGLLIFSWKDIMGRDFSSVGIGVLRKLNI